LDTRLEQRFDRLDGRLDDLERLIRERLGQ
jgi:hypothetical protein